MTDPTVKKHYPLPLVVVPRSEARGRIEWSFDPLVQFLANRGYGVLQVDCRGASGYGLAYQRAGRSELNGRILSDITDATNWAISTGYADPGRVAILGFEFAAACALNAAAKSPEIFRCVIGINGAYDYRKIVKAKKNPDGRGVYEFWQEKIGDLANGDDDLIAFSALEHVKNFEVPTLLIQSSASRYYPVSGLNALKNLIATSSLAPWNHS
jgi:dipeptidyl aminopeptidase/acylaminoacyl peptidase